MRRIKNPLFALSFVFLMTVSVFLGYSLSYRNLILPNIYVSNIEVGGLNSEIAEAKISKAFNENQNETVFVLDSGEVMGTLGDIKLKRDYKWISDQALKVGRSGNIFTNIKERVEVVFKPRHLLVPLVFDENELDNLVEEVAINLEVAPIKPKVTKKDKKFVFVEGKQGLLLNREKLKAGIREKLSYPGKQTLTVPLAVAETGENKEQVNKVLDRLNSWGDQPLLIKYKEYNKNLTVDEVAELLGLGGNTLNQEGLSSLVIELSEKIETEPKDAVFEFEEGRVKEFKQEVVGVSLDRPKFEEVLGSVLASGAERTVNIPVILNEPNIKAGDINNLGIKELLGVGKSTFAHSIPGRVFNVNLAASRIKGVVVAPGEEFSFNKAVGIINRQTGYQTAYIISEGRTVLGDGGGVCQVSTTTFRAAMNAGLPITERRAHAYRVGYYEQDSPPGLDATIYSPTTDFKFLNDTGNHILVQTKVDTEKLTMQVEIYGTSDGRTATVSKPIVSNQSSAPAASYVDDPNLQKGTTKQIDWSAAGARVSFDYKVVRGGETLFEKKFISNYQPWRAVYLVGTKE